MPRGVIEEAAALIAASRRTIALTGAGISVPSGIPDFRSPTSGLWAQHDPMEVASLASFRADPSRFFAWFQPLARLMHAAVPNPAHHALAALQAAGRIGPIITQNIDGLHEAAGSRDVLTVHGQTRTATCLGCGVHHPASAFWDEAVAGRVPHCPDCGGVLKPDVILFGELLPEAIYHRALRAAQHADLVLVAGSSLEVWPVAGLPWESLRRGGRLLIVNVGPTALDGEATLKVEADVAEALPAIVAALGEA